MVLLQPKLNLKVTQKQILTPGLVQMVSVLALNKLELRDMINAEIVENPVLDELDENVPLIDEVAGKEADRERPKDEEHEQLPEEKDPFDEVDFGSYFQDYLDPGYRSTGDFENSERPSFENFISKPSTLTDHLMWQLGALGVDDAVREAAELVIGNLNEDGYLIASDEELMKFATGQLPSQSEPEIAAANPAAAGEGDETISPLIDDASGEVTEEIEAPVLANSAAENRKICSINSNPHLERWNSTAQSFLSNERHSTSVAVMPLRHSEAEPKVRFTAEDLKRAIELIRQMDPIGVAARDLRECLLAQLQCLRLQLQPRGKVQLANGKAAQLTLIQDTLAIVDTQLRSLQNKQHKEIARAIGRPVEAVMAAVDCIRTLAPKRGQ